MEVSIDFVCEEIEENHEDTGGFGVPPYEEPSAASTNRTFSLITPAVVAEVQQQIYEDKCLPSDIRESFKCDKDGLARLAEQLGFMNDCLVPRSRFINSTAEKAWNRFNTACGDNLPRIAAALDKPPPYVFHFCLKIFTKLVEVNYYSAPATASSATASTSATPTAPTPVSCEEKDILHYIGGSIVRKVQDKLKRRQDCSDTLLNILQTMKADTAEPEGTSTESETQSLTAQHDRGGLTYVKPAVTTLLTHMEDVFRMHFSLTGFSTSAFVAHCLNSAMITTCFFEIAYDCDSEDDDKTAILTEICKLFHKIRIHHKCKSLMDAYRAKKCLPKKQKGLRKNLKAKD